jgi:threonine aldolase
MHFASDNAAGVAPPILDAIKRANDGYALGYGSDALTRRVERTFSDLFERDVAVFLVATGTAANSLAIAHLAPPWGAVLCHHEAHIMTSECGAPEFFGGGLKLVGLPGDAGRIAPDVLKATLEGGEWGGPHHVSPAVLSLTQATEAGTIYRPAEIASLAEIAHASGMSVQLDGARFANALARLGTSPAAATWKAGVDVLALGATKGGAMAAEAVIFFDPARVAAMGERRKRAGHLISKHRFVAAQFEAFLREGLWLTLAGHANRMADLLAQALTGAGFRPLWSVEANLVFVVLPQHVHKRLTAAGASYYEMRRGSAPAAAFSRPDDVLVRLVTSFSTTTDDIDRFAAAIRT